MATGSPESFEHDHVYYFDHGLKKANFSQNAFFGWCQSVLLHYGLPAKTINSAQLLGGMRKIAAIWHKNDDARHVVRVYCWAMKTRCLHITGSHAIRLMRAARAKDVVTAKECDETRVTMMGDRIGSLADLGIDTLLDYLNISPKNPLELLVPDSSSRCWITGVKTSVLSKDLPRGAFLEVGEGIREDAAIRLPSNVRILIDSPALALVRASSTLGKNASSSYLGELEARLRLIALACEFCGSYARDPLHPHSGTCHFDKPKACECFVDPSRLGRFLQEAPRLSGTELARQAVRYVIDGSGSLMETFVNLAWSLPPRLAGLSMPRPLANKELVVSDAVKKRMPRTGSLRPDYQWPEYRVVAEYLGDKEHASHGARVEDKNRQQNYAVADYKAFFFMFDDVRSVDVINRTALMLAREFAKHGLHYEPYRIRKLCKKKGFRDCQLKLVKTLLPPAVRYGETRLVR